MAKEYSRTQRVADYLQRELATLIQHELRDPRVGMVSVTGVDVSRDLRHARVYYTVMGSDSSEEAKDDLNQSQQIIHQLRIELEEVLHILKR